MGFTGRPRWAEGALGASALLELGGNAALIIHGDHRDLDSGGAGGALALQDILHQRAAHFCRQERFQTFIWKLVEVAGKLVSAIRRVRPEVGRW